MANKKEIRARLDGLLAQGLGKSEIFNQLTGQGVRDRQIAQWLAEIPDMEARREQSLNIGILSGLMLAQALIIFAVTLSTSTLLACALALIPLAFMLGFRKPRAGAYQGYVLLSAIGIGRNIGDFVPPTLESMIGLAITLAIVVLVYRVQRRLFPDMAWSAPQRRDGIYVFST